MDGGKHTGRHHPQQMGEIPCSCLACEAPGSRGAHPDPLLRGSEPAAAPKGRCAAVRITAGTRSSKWCAAYATQVIDRALRFALRPAARCFVPRWAHREGRSVACAMERASSLVPCGLPGHGGPCVTQSEKGMTEKPQNA